VFGLFGSLPLFGHLLLGVFGPVLGAFRAFGLRGQPSTFGVVPVQPFTFPLFKFPDFSSYG
jgi:hypothetical protein